MVVQPKRSRFLAWVRVIQPSLMCCGPGTSAISRFAQQSRVEILPTRPGRIVRLSANKCVTKDLHL